MGRSNLGLSIDCPELAWHCPGRYWRNWQPIGLNEAMTMRKLVRPAGFEPAASGLEVPRSIQLSYGRKTLQGVLECSILFLNPCF
jgi:hypothetical protein